MAKRSVQSPNGTVKPQKRKSRNNGEGSVYQRKGDGRWVAAVTVGFDSNGRQKRRYFYGDSEREVRLERDQALAKLRKQRLPSDGRLTVGQFLDRWLEESVKPLREPMTYQTYESLVRLHLKPGLGRIRIVDLKASDIDALVVAKRAGLKGSTVAGIRNVLRTALSQAENWGLVERNVVRLSRPVTFQLPDRPALTPGQAQALLDVLEGHPLEMMFTLCLALGLRLSEARGLLWENIDFGAKQLSIVAQINHIGGSGGAGWVRRQLKSRFSARTLPLADFLVDMLRDHRVEMTSRRSSPFWVGSQWDLVFATATGKPTHGHSAWYQWKQLLQRAGLPHMRIHDLRHGAASLWLAKGVPLEVVSRLLGHSSISITMDIYGHVAEALKRDASDRMADALQRPSRPRPTPVSDDATTVLHP